MSVSFNPVLPTPPTIDPNKLNSSIEWDRIMYGIAYRRAHGETEVSVFPTIEEFEEKNLSVTFDSSYEILHTWTFKNDD